MENTKATSILNDIMEKLSLVKKDEVKEVRESMECGMAFENYSDIQEGDMIECFELTEVARTLD